MQAASAKTCKRKRALSLQGEPKTYPSLFPISSHRSCFLICSSSMGRLKMYTQTQTEGEHIGKKPQRHWINKREIFTHHEDTPFNAQFSPSTLSAIFRRNLGIPDGAGRLGCIDPAYSAAGRVGTVSIKGTCNSWKDSIKSSWAPHRFVKWWHCWVTLVCALGSRALCSLKCLLCHIPKCPGSPWSWASRGGHSQAQTFTRDVSIQSNMEFCDSESTH